MSNSIFCLLETVTDICTLNQTQALVLQKVWEGRTYAQIAEDAGYSLDYIKSVGSELWQWLSDVFDEPVSKRNLRSIINDHLSQGHAQKPDIVNKPATCQDWGEAIDTSRFFGRSAELATLETWMLHERCRLISVAGMAGVGKTALTIHCAEQLHDQFEFVIWRSLRNAPPISALLDDLLQFLACGQTTGMPTDLNSKFRQLLTYVQQHRCLILLDNWESLLASCSIPH